MLAVFLVLLQTTISAVTAALWLSSHERAVARLRGWSMRWWRPALLGLVLVPVTLVAGSGLGWFELAPMERVWLAVLAGPLAGGDPSGCTEWVAFIASLLAAIGALPVLPRWWTFLLAGIAVTVWCTVGFIIGVSRCCGG